MTLQLRIGGKYRRRDGAVVEIVKYDQRSIHPWICDRGQTYRKDGYRHNPFNAGSLDLILEIPNTKDNDMKAFDLAAVDKLTALCSEGRHQVKQLVTEVVTSLGGKVKEEVKPEVGQVWVDEFKDPYLLGRYTICGYSAINLISGTRYLENRNTPPKAVAGLTYAAASVEEYFQKKAKGGQL